MIDHDFFSVINTESKAYWLGFMFADGNIHQQKSGRKVVNITQKDRSVLEKFCTDLSCEYKIGKRTKAHYEWYVISIYSDKLFDDLLLQGCTPAKSKTLGPPSNIPDSLISHFIRGYNDGDGGIYIRKGHPLIRIRGTIEFLQWVSDRLPAKSCLYEGGPTAQLMSHGSFAAINVEYLYQNATIYKDDKYAVAMSILT